MPRSRNLLLRHLFFAVTLISVVLGVPACKRNADGQLPVASGEAIKAQRETVKGFAVVRAYPEQRTDALTIAVEFSRPLVGTQEFDKLLRIDATGEDQSGWALSDDGKVLRYANVETNKTYTLKIAGSLTAADGTILGKDQELKVYTGELQPAVGFASQGSVIPAKESRGLPVVSVNVDEVDVEFLRVRDAALPKFFAEYQRSGKRSNWELDPSWYDPDDADSRSPISKLAEPVYMNRFVLGGARNERVLTYLPIQSISELQKPGLYFAVMKKTGSFKGEFDTAFFSVSDIGLHVRAYKDKVFVHTASLATGDGLSGVELKVLDARGEAVFKASTDSNGNAMLNYTLDAAHVLTALRGKDMSMLSFNQPALDLSEFSVGGREQAWFDVFAWSGRDLYRPGETVRVSALLRNYDGKPVLGKNGKAQSLFVRLKQPDGKTFVESRIEPGAQGYFRFEKTIPAEAPTGRWQVEFRLDPASKVAVQGMSLRIEEFLPERMKLDLDSAAPILRPGQAFALQAKGAYLYGAPASGNRFTAKLAVKVDQHPLAALKGWFFGDPTVSLPTAAKDVIDASLDASGELRQDIALPAEVKGNTPVQAIVAGSLFESGGRSINRSVSRTLWPADVLVGVRPLFDDADGANPNTNAGFELMRYDRGGKPQAGKGLKLSLVRELRDYHWTHDDSSGWKYDFTRRYKTIDTRTVDVGNTALRFDMPVEWGDYRLEVYDPATRLTMRYPFHAGWGWDDENRGLDARPDKVKLALDKTSYRSGDKLKVTLTPPHAGKGVVMVESDHMLFVQSVDVKPGTVVEIPVTQDWERHDVYVTALVLRGGSAASKITPARAVGEAFVPMDRSARKLAVGLAVKAQVRPQQPLQVTVSAPQLAGKQAYATVSAVDVGILNITRFAVPDANAHFFAQRRLGVDAYDIYGRVIESFDGATARMRFGGDMALAALPQARRPTARVQTVDLFAGPVQLDAKGIARVAVNVPDFNGTLRVSALVYSDTQYGNKDAEVVVRAPIVAEASMPRAMAPGDRGMVTLDISNYTGKPGAFKLQVDGIGPATIAEGSRSLTLGSEAKSTVSFPLSAQEGYGVAQVRVRVEGNGFKVDRHYDLPVRPAWPSVLRSRAQVLGASAASMDVSLADGLMPGSVRARMLVSALPPIPFGAALKGALDYPYGCAEQTTSKGYAALALDADTAQRFGVTGLTPEQRRARMDGAFGRLASMQLGNGHFSMWGSDDNADPQLTPYIVEFLLDARQAGFAVPDSVLQKALQRLSDDLLSGGAQFYGRDHREYLKFAYKAYAGYVLARVNRAPLGTLRALYDNDRKQALKGLPLVQLGLALALQGDKVRGEKAIAEGFAFKGDRQGWLGDYGSPLRDTALMLAMTHERGYNKPAYDAKVIELGRDLEARRAASPWLWLSTQEQIALARLGKALLVSQTKQVAGKLTVAGVDEVIAASKGFSREVDYATLAKGLRFLPQGDGPFYASLDVAGVPRTAPAADARLIKVERSLYTTDGKPWAPRALKEGEALIVRVAITADRDMPDALLTDLLPAGLEIENFNLGDAKQWADVVVDGINISERANEASLNHEEFRDDRYVAALKLNAGSTAKVFYLVRAVTPGNYTVPPSLVEDMYRPELRGVGKAVPERITVVQP